MNKLTLGSLFDGSGGFPLGGLISGITRVEFGDRAVSRYGDHEAAAVYETLR